MLDSIEERKTFVVAYAKGILKTLGISIKEKSEQSQSSVSAKYFVQVGTYANRENAKKQLQKAKDAGFTYAFIRVI